MPSLNSLRAFEAVARHLSYQLAAEELRVTPAAVKQLVSKLEASVGSPLLERKGRGLALTPRGTAGRSDLNAAMQHMVSSVHKMRGHEKEKRLIVTVESSFATTWLSATSRGLRRWSMAVGLGPHRVKERPSARLVIRSRYHRRADVQRRASAMQP